MGDIAKQGLVNVNWGVILGEHDVSEASEDAQTQMPRHVVELKLMGNLCPENINVENALSLTP